MQLIQNIKYKSELLSYYDTKRSACGSQQETEAKPLTSMSGLAELADKLNASIVTKRLFEQPRHFDPHKTLLCALGYLRQTKTTLACVRSRETFTS